MTSMELLAIVTEKARRDRRLPLRAWLSKGVRYATELATARFYLRDVDELGEHARTFGRPRIINLGRMEFGSHLLVRSIVVRSELGTGLNGILRIGHGVRLNYGTSVYAECEVTIGDRVRIGPYSSVSDTDFHDAHDHSIKPPGTPVHIEDDVWVGAKAAILKGVRIGRASVIGTGSVVTRDVPAFSIVAGAPARIIGSIDPSLFKPGQYK